MSARPIRIRSFLHDIGYWRIVTLATFSTLAAARAWLDRFPTEHIGAEFIDHRDAPATPDHMNAELVPRIT